MANEIQKGIIGGVVSRLLLCTFMVSICWITVEVRFPIDSFPSSTDKVSHDKPLPSLQGTNITKNSASSINKVSHDEPLPSLQGTNIRVTSSSSIDKVSRHEPLPSLQAANITGTSSSSIDKVSHDEPLPSLQGTNITGRNSIISFREYLRCISESGRWVYDTTPRHIPWNYAGHVWSTDCERRHPGLKGEAAEQASVTAQNWTVREALKWAWVTNATCPFQPVNRDELCKLIGTRGNMMVVGDSINHQIQVSIINNLIKDPNAQKIVRDEQDICTICPGFPVCGDVLGNGHEFNVSFVRNEKVSLVEKRHTPFSWHQEWPWKNLIKESDVKTLLINRGAHYFSDEILLPELNSTFSFLKHNHPDLLVIYRNTPPGHMNCTPDMTRPLEGRQNFSIINEHHWGDFRRQNSLVEALVEQFGFIYIDVDSMLSLRQDGHLRHGDCLHYCVPGPLDSAVQLLYNVLKAIPRFST